MSRSRSVTPADRSYDLIDAATYNFINSSRPPKILESPLDSKSLSAGEVWAIVRDIQSHDASLAAKTPGQEIHSL